MYHKKTKCVRSFKPWKEEDLGLSTQAKNMLLHAIPFCLWCHLHHRPVWDNEVNLISLHESATFSLKKKSPISIIITDRLLN